MSTLIQEQNNVRPLLFASFGVTVEKAQAYLADMEIHPEKVTKYSQLLNKLSSEQYDLIRQKPAEELGKMAKERVKEWARRIGPVSTHEYVTMSKQWDIPIDSIINEKITPELIKKMLDFFVIGQEKYKVKLSVAFFTYLMHGRQANSFLPKSNLLVCGPSGSGKTYGMQTLTKLFHVPFVTIHCNSLVQEGIVGPGLTDGFTSLLTQGWLKEEIERAVVCFDEFDKLFEKNTNGGDSGYYNSRVVNEMLNIIDDKGEVEFAETFEKSGANRIKLPTRKMMFVFTGVFNGLREETDTVEPTGYVQRKPIGFKKNNQPLEEPVADEETGEPTFDDFIDFGVKPEIMGRIQNFVFLDSLTEEEMLGLFDLGTTSPFSEFEQYFAINGIDTVLTDEGKHTLAKLACERKLGVRGLKSLLQQVLLEDMYDLEVGKDNILNITRQYIMDNLNK